MDNQEKRFTLLEKALQASIDQYKDETNNFTNLDTKAQNTAAIDCIFLAAALAFLRGKALEQFIEYGGVHTLCFLGLSIVFFIFSIFCCLRGIRIKEIVGPISSVIIYKMTSDILRADSPNMTDESYESYFKTLITYWQKPIEDISEKNERKAEAVLDGQYSLVFAIVFVVITLVIILYSAGFKITT